MTNKILVVGPAWVGDMVMAQCLFKLLKQRQPTIEIEVLAPAWSLPLLARMPEVSEGHVMPVGHGQLALLKRYRLGKSLRARAYQQAIVLPNSFKSGLIPFFAKIPVRTGWRGEMRYGVLNDVRQLNKERYPLMIDRFMALGLAPHEYVAFSEQTSEQKLLPELQISINSCVQALSKYQLEKTDKPILALCPGAEFGPAKRWPEEYYAAVANEKLAEGWDVWLFGSPKDAVVAERIMALTQERCINLTGKTQLEDAIDLLSLAEVVLSNDSGLMHVAAALHKPLVVVYGPTSAAFTPPLNSRAKIISLSMECQPCFARECPLVHHQCMRDLGPEKVLSAMKELLA